MIEEEGAYLRCVVTDDDGKPVIQRMVQIPGRPGWFVNEDAWRRLTRKKQM
jgi:hypothetical protein